MAVRFRLSTDIPAPIERVFDLSRSIDVHLGSMASSGEIAVAGVTSGLIDIGETVTWRARHFGITWTMTSRITACEPCRLFADQQHRGPFQWFHHEHHFSSIEGGTRMVDEVAFAAPFGLIGRVAEKLVLGRYLRRLIERRNAYIAEAASAPREHGT